MIIGFGLAAYAIVANDSIQTLGTFISSNTKRPWWVLWLWISSILVGTVVWGWVQNGGDPAFGRLSASGKDIPFPAEIHFLFIIPPLVLVILTRFGIPVSTSLLVLTGFKGLVAAQEGEDAKGAIDLFQGMMEKSLSGYVIAFVLGLIIFSLVVGTLEKRFAAQSEEKRSNPHMGWIIFQWGTTGFLWSMWLVQDLANIFCYLPRELTWWGLALSLGGMVLLQGWIFRERGGKIQKVVTSKSSTMDVRSATFVDLLYAIVLLFFKLDILKIWPDKLPMSTTWVFLGLLAGREIGLALRLRARTRGEVSKLIFLDAGKALLGSVIAIALALLLPVILKMMT